jgi:hypothetical protein
MKRRLLLFAGTEDLAAPSPGALEHRPTGRLGSTPAFRGIGYLRFRLTRPPEYATAAVAVIFRG